MTNPTDADKGVAAIPPFGLRMRPELKRRLEGAARANNRSLNSEIVARLEQSFRDESQPTTTMPAGLDYEERLSALENLVKLVHSRRLDAVDLRLIRIGESVDKLHKVVK